MSSPDGSGEVWCVVVAAGGGRRFGAPKQFAELGDERVVDASARVASLCCDGVVAVVPSDALGTPDGIVPAADVVVSGGADRSASTRCGVAAVPRDAAVILVHDGARPLVHREVFDRVIDAVREGADAVIPVVPVTDTIRDLAGEVVDRDRLRAVQTPQGFRAEVLRKALEDPGEATDDAALVAATGCELTMVRGDPVNRKLTTPVDLLFAEAVVAATASGRKVADVVMERTGQATSCGYPE